MYVLVVFLSGLVWAVCITAYVSTATSDLQAAADKSPSSMESGNGMLLLHAVAVADAVADADADADDVADACLVIVAVAIAVLHKRTKHLRSSLANKIDNDDDKEQQE